MRWIFRRFLFITLSSLGLVRFLTLLRGSAFFARLASRWPLADGDDCLAESFRVLAHSPKARMVFGVRRFEGRWQAHAWVEDPAVPPADRDGFRRLGSL
jgi:hypothetical protein